MGIKKNHSKAKFVLSEGAPTLAGTSNGKVKAEMDQGKPISQGRRHRGGRGGHGCPTFS